MKTLHLAAAALNTTPKDWIGNTEKILAVLAEAARRRIDFVCLPELCITGYGCEDEFHAPYVAETALHILEQQIVPAVKGFGAAVGLPLGFAGSTYNVIAVIVDGVLLGFTAKQNLAGDGIHYEPRFFKQWPVNTVVRLTTPRGSTVPLGDVIYEIGGIRFALEICEDAWVAGRPGISHSRHGVDVILNPSASHFTFGKTVTRERFVLEGSRAFNCAYVYANLVGNEAGRAIYDGDCFIASAGGIRAFASRFSFADWTLTDAVVDIERNRVGRARLASYCPDFGQEGIITHPYPWNNDKDGLIPSPMITRAVEDKNEEFARAVALGLFDYLKKTYCRGYALSFSGGTDSAACAVLVHLMVRFATGQARAFLETLTRLPQGADDRALTGRLLACAYQASTNSGETTLNAAKAVAEEIGARFVNFNIAPLVEQCEQLLSTFLGRPLDWERDDITRQNIQARVRNPPIWAIANAENFLLLTTSNRSEATVGYCTMDGDTAGSLAPVAGVDKVFLLEWLAWARATYDLPALDLVTRQIPTAELKPATFHQTDEADLGGSYAMINRIQKLLVVEKKSPRDIFHLLANASECGAPLAREQIYRAIAKILTLWSRSQWKRERYAPSFHLDDENLDPRTWCRYPILSGNYAHELAVLKKEVFG
ncbi:NAD+ synthetase [Opitutaceae bacterium TAV1]|nr:NAD+ synthetase [Opitutaceae bacterium TAV1]